MSTSAPSRRGRARLRAAALAAGAAALIAPTAAHAIPSLPDAASPALHLSVQAGNGLLSAPVAGPALASPLEDLRGIGRDSAGNLYTSSYGYIVRVAPDGNLTVIAGTGSASTPTPGPAASSSVGDLMSVAAGPDGTVYFFEWISKSLYRISPAGVLSRVAGTGVNAAPVPGAAAASPLRQAGYSLAVDGGSGAVYLTNSTDTSIVKITADGTLSVIDLDVDPHTVAVSPAGVVHFVDDSAGLYKVTGGTATLVKTVYGSGSTQGGLAVDEAGNAYVSVYDRGYVAKVAPDGTETRIAGDGTTGDPTEGPATASHLSPRALVLDGAGTVYAATGELLITDLPQDGSLACSCDPEPGRIVRLGAEVPSAPRELKATAQTTSLELTFLAPVTPGTSAITRYEVSLDGGATWQALTTTTADGRLVAVLSGLTAGTPYIVSVRAVNAKGAGLATAGVSVSTVSVPRSDPGKPVALSDNAVKKGLTATRSGSSAVVTLPLQCPPGPQGCDASGTLTVNLPESSRPRAASLVPVRLATFTGVKINAGEQRLYKVRLAKQAVERMQKGKVFKTTATLKVDNHLSGAATVSSTQTVPLTIPRPVSTCSTKRTLTVHWITRRADRLKAVTITANGERVKALGGRARQAKLFFAAGEPRIVTVVIRATTTTGRKLVSMRRVRLCGATKAGYKKTKHLVLKPTTAGSR
ncbi:MAG: fibronectin type III domain-containing protein [Solirubrobacteraceae bacterium]|nr:fibronectin type III domain-containing protein [Solirubrobacteraceae bacterium]